MRWSPPEEQSFAGANGFTIADGAHSDPSGELGSANILAIDFPALRRAYLLEQVCSKVGIEGVDGAPAAQEAGQPALLRAKLASNFARSAAALTAC